MSIRAEMLKRYLLEDPSDCFLRYALAMEFIWVNDHENAYEHLEKLLIDEPDYLAAYYQAGKSAEALGKNKQASDWYAKGIEVARQQKDQHALNELSAALSLMEDIE